MDLPSTLSICVSDTVVMGVLPVPVKSTYFPTVFSVVTREMFVDAVTNQANAPGLFISKQYVKAVL